MRSTVAVRRSVQQQGMQWAVVAVDDVVAEEAACYSHCSLGVMGCPWASPRGWRPTHPRHGQGGGGLRRWW